MIPHHGGWMIILQHKSEMNSWNGTQRGQEKRVKFKTFSVNFNISFSMSQWSLLALGFHFSLFSGCIQTLKAGYTRVWFACCEKNVWPILGYCKKKRGQTSGWFNYILVCLFVLSFPPLTLIVWCTDFYMGSVIPICALLFCTYWKCECFLNCHFFFLFYHCFYVINCCFYGLLRKTKLSKR